MKKIIKTKTIQSYLMLLMSLLSIEIIFSYLNKGNIFNLSFVKIFLLLNIISLLLSLITSFFKTKVTYIMNFILIFFFSVYAWLQLRFYDFLGVYISLNTGSQFGAVTDYIKDFLRGVRPISFILYIPFLVVLCFFIIKSIFKKDNYNFLIKSKYQNKIVNIILLINIIVSAGAFNIFLSDKFNSDSYQVVSSKDLFLTAANPSLYVKEFGIVSYAFSDVRTKISGSNDTNITYFAYDNQTERKLDDSSWNELISTESDKTYNALNKYYINNLITDKNEYTGLFKDKNLIVVMLESVNDVIYNEKYFPNFYKLASEGWYFENNYSPRNSCATGNNEFSTLTSLYSIYNECTTNTFLDNKYPEAIFNLFNNKNYYTNSFHNFTEHYYYRETYHKNMGSQNYYGVESLDIDYSEVYGEWASDEDLMTRYLEKIDELDKNQKFMSYITTVSSHQPFLLSSTYGDMHLDMTEDTDYSIDLRRYMSKLKVVDDALGILIDGLEERKMLDDTVIILFGDHYPYAIENETLNEILTRNLDDYEIEKVPLVIYNSKMFGNKKSIMQSKTYDTYTSYMNLLPTIANLFDLDFDPRLYAGVDIFSKDYNNTVVFPDSSWKNDKAFYDATTGKVIYNSDFKYTDDEIRKLNAYFYAKMNASSLAIKYDYFNYLDENLKKISNEGNEKS